jgi:hypothetical protein
MSIGNLKDSGNQGNNMPFQWKVLQGLQEIANQVGQPLTCVDDSVSICADGKILTGTNIGSATGLDVNIIGGVTLEVNLDAANDQVGVYGYINGASGSPVPLNVNATGQVAIQDGGNSITVDGGTGVSRTPTILRTSASSTVAAGTYSMSFASVGTVNATVGGQTLKPGETINFDAGAINNTLGSVAYNSSAVGAELLIITLT